MQQSQQLRIAYLERPCMNIPYHAGLNLFKSPVSADSIELWFRWPLRQVPDPVAAVLGASALRACLAEDLKVRTGSTFVVSAFRCRVQSLQLRT